MIPLPHILFIQADATTKPDPTQVLRHPLRRSIHQLVEKSPGILQQTLAEELGCTRGKVRYHVGRLRSAGLIQTVSYDQRTHLFLDTQLDPRARRTLAVLQRGRTWDLARQVAKQPGQPQRHLTQTLRMSRKILRKYADRLLERGLIREVERPPFRTYFPTSTLHEMVDQFDRLIPPRKASPSREMPEFEKLRGQR